MGWKGAVRSMVAYQRAQVRSERREQRAALVAAQRAAAGRERDAVERLVELYETHMRLLSTVHHDCGPKIDWEAVLKEENPAAPGPIQTRTLDAEAAIAMHRPGFFSRLFGGAAKQRALLESALAAARHADEEATRLATSKHLETCRDLEHAREIAAAMLRREHVRYQDALLAVDALDELAGVALTAQINSIGPHVVEMVFGLPSADAALPDEQVAMTKRGKLSTKAIPKTRANEIYQDFVCGVALRGCREAFAALPIEWCCVTITTELLDSSTGHQAMQPVLSVLAPRRTTEALRYEALDPSSAMSNFLHRMGFKKSTGMKPIEPLSMADVPADPV